MAHGVRREWTFAAARRRPLLRGRSGARPAVPRRRPRTDLPTLPQTARGKAVVRPASSPRRADSGCGCLDRAAARRAPHGTQTSHKLGPRLEEPRQGTRALRAAPPGRRHHPCAPLPWRRQADRAPRRRLYVLTALPHVAAGRPRCEWGPPSIYGASRTQSDTGLSRLRHTTSDRPATVEARVARRARRSACGVAGRVTHLRRVVQQRAELRPPVSLRDPRTASARSTSRSRVAPLSAKQRLIRKAERDPDPLTSVHDCFDLRAELTGTVDGLARRRARLAPIQ
jgi:hypothetical protein